MSTKTTPRGTTSLILHEGARLKSDEFLERYSNMPELKKAELINGVAYMTPTVSNRHGNPHADLICWLGFYRLYTPGVTCGDNVTTIFDEENTFQPDVYFRVLSQGTASGLTPEGYLTQPPDWIAEIATTSARLDLGPKMEVYARHGVREYLVWRTEDREIDWFVLREGEYQPLSQEENGIIRSEVFPGLWLHAEALLNRNLAQLAEGVELGCQHPSHAEFVAQIQRRS
jgi:Uma2 family endonuclease